MELTLQTFLIVCPLIFLAGFVDSIAGGGGIISLPAYILAGVPTHQALGTNKFSSAIGCFISTGKYVQQGCVNKRLILPTVVAALIGSAAGANFALMTDEKYLKYLMIVVLPIVAFIVLFKKNLMEVEDNVSLPPAREMILSVIAALVIGCYDGFYGPGTGTFMILIFTGLVKLNVKEANGNAKCVNLASNVAAMVTYLVNGKTILILGVVAALFSIAGNYLGTALVIKNGSKIVRPIMIIVLILLFIKVITG